MKPRILILNKAPVYERAGAESVAWRLGNHLAQNGWGVHYLCPTSDRDPPETNVTIHEVPTPEGRTASMASYFLLSIKPYLELYDEIQPSLVYDNASPIPHPLPYLLGHDPVTKVHTPYNGLLSFSTQNNLIESFGVFFGEQLYRGISGERMITVSESVTERFSKIVRTGADAIRTIPNGITTNKYRPKYTPGGDFVTLCELTPRKNIDLVIDAWKRIEETNLANDRNLIIAGTGPQEKKLRKKANRHGLDNIIFSGYISEQKKIALYANAYCYVLPTAIESFGLTNMEAMASECIVISTDTVGVRDYIEHGQNGLLINDPSPQAIFSTIASILPPGNRERELATAARETALRYDIDAVLCREERILKSYL